MSKNTLLTESWLSDYAHLYVLGDLQSFLKTVFLTRLRQALSAALELCSGMRDLWLWPVNTWLQLVGSSALTRDRTQAPALGTRSLGQPGMPRTYSFDIKNVHYSRLCGT